MGETRQEIKLISVELKYSCDCCGSKNVKPTGIVLTSNPPQYQHKCSDCGLIMNLSNEYPMIIFEKEKV